MVFPSLRLGYAADTCFAADMTEILAGVLPVSLSPGTSASMPQTDPQECLIGIHAKSFLGNATYRNSFELNKLNAILH